MKQYALQAAVALGALSLVVMPMSALADTVGIDFESYAPGSVNGQDGWSSTGAYDQAVGGSLSTTGFGARSLRISDAVTSGSFGDQTFTKSLVNEVGETVAENNGMSGGTRMHRLTAQFDIASTMQVEQPGLHVSVSPDRGDGARMSYLRFEDQADGIHIYFDDVTNPTSTLNGEDFNETDIATIDRGPHTIKLVLDALDGPHNDVVTVYVDGVLKASGTSWEDYYRFDTESNPSAPSDTSRTVDSLLFRESGDATPANAGNGFLIDNVNLTSGPIPASTVTVTIAKYLDGVMATPANAANASFSMNASWSATNIGSGSGSFALSPTPFNSQTAYTAVTADMTSGASYSVSENAGTTCTNGTPALVGYSVGDDQASAALATPTLTVPNLTNITSNKYIIVWNKTCPAAPTVKVHILKFLNGILATSASAAGYQFPMVATWSATNIGAGTGNYVLGNFFGGATVRYGADTAPMSGVVNYTTSEITKNIDPTSKVLPANAKCVPGMYKLVGYSKGATLIGALLAPTTTTAPTFTGLTSDRYVLVKNITCKVHPKKKDECKRDLWRNFHDMSFRNQGQCEADSEHDHDD